MELRDFVSNTLTQIMEGLRDAVREQKNDPKNGLIGAVSQALDPSSGNGISNVEFDVAVTVATKASGTGGLSIEVAGVGLGGKIGRSKETTTANRIRFTVPILPPIAPLPRDVFGKVDMSDVL